MEQNNVRLDHLFTAIYGELFRRAARAFRKEPVGHAMEPAALVHEVFLRCRRQRKPPQDREHLLALASLMMHRILISAARSRNRRLAGQQPLDEADLLAAEIPEAEGFALRQAMRQLRLTNPRGYQVTRLRFFAGLENREIADRLGVSATTVKRDWKQARDFLERQLRRVRRRVQPSA